MSDIRIGIIGIGAMGRHHVRNARETPGFELVGLVDPSGDRFGVAKGMEVYPTVGELLAKGIDAAVVAVPTAFHKEVGLELARAGVHTLIEKPLAPSVTDGKELVEAFAAAGVVAGVGYVERCNPALREARRRVAAGQLGEVYQITTRRQGPFPARISDVGVIKDLATHDVDLTAWVAGSAYEMISAQTARKSGREFEDLVVATGRLQNGILVNHVVNWFSPFKERVTTISGEKGTLVADTMASELTFYANGTESIQWDQIAAVRGVSEGEIVTYALQQREPLRVEHEAFRDAILGKDSEIVKLADALHTLEVLEAMVTSAASGSTERL